MTDQSKGGQVRSPLQAEFRRRFNGRNATLRERFEAQYMPITETGCWLWTGNYCGPKKVKADRPVISVNGKQKSAYRVSFELHNGPIPDGAFICHICHVSMCVNPAHLYAGDRRSNFEDSLRAGRHIFQKNPHAMREISLRGQVVRGYRPAHFTDDQMREIRAALTNYKFGAYARLGKLYNVNHEAISRIHAEMRTPERKP